MAPSDEGAVERSETEGEKRLRFYAVIFLSLRLFAYAKSHLPRQREARALGADSSLQTPICFLQPLFKGVAKKMPLKREKQNLIKEEALIRVCVPRHSVVKRDEKDETTKF